MLVELRVRNLGVIEDQSIVFGPGLSALTGETGAGKTLIVDAIVLLAGGAADPTLVRPGASEALVEGRFVKRSQTGGDVGGADVGGADVGGADVGGADVGGADVEGEEIVVSRVVPALGRSRCYVDGRMVAASTLGEVAAQLVEINGQHGFHYLLSAQVQRDIVDRAGQIDTVANRTLRREITRIRGLLDELGGDPTSRARQFDLLGYQLGEIEAAAIVDPGEEASLLAEQQTLADASGTIEVARRLHEALAGDGGIIEGIGAAVSLGWSRPALSALGERLAGLQEELTDAARQARGIAEALEDDPGRLAEVGERLRILGDLRRKYGATLVEVLDYATRIRAEIDELVSHDDRVRDYQASLTRAEADLREADKRVRDARAAVAPQLAGAVEAELASLALPRARFGVEISSAGDGQPVAWMFAANPGQPMLALAKVASGGELARVMLATRIAIGRALRARLDADGNAGPETLIFDEVDAGVGGEAAVAVGRALAELARDRQVLVVTHLAQVAAFADHQIAVVKDFVQCPDGDRVVARASSLDGSQRVVELARMLSGQPESLSAQLHAEELLGSARREVL